jgi:hypothetical protein
MLTALLAAGATAVPAQGLRPEQVSALSPSFAPAGAERPYEDRVLETGPQQADAADTDEGYNAQGWARSLRFEYSLGATRGASSSRSHAVAVSGYVETPLYGTLSLLGTLVDASTDGAGFAGTRREDRTSTWRLDQRAMPLEGGWLANHSAGQTSTLVPPLARGLSRVYLPTTPISGAGGQWLLRDDLDLNAAFGQPGLYAGRDINGFEAQRGQVATLGGQARLLGTRNSATRVDAALQLVQARDSESLGLAPGQQLSSAWGTLAWEGPAPWGDGVRAGPPADSVASRPGGARFQFSFLQSSAGAGGGAGGSWLDAAWRTGLVQHTAGAFKLQPDLRWGPTAMPADLRGGYWRGDAATRQWQAGWSTELSDSVSGRFGRSGFGNVHGRYLLDTRNGLDASLAVRTGTTSAESLQLNFDHGSDWGQTRWRGSVLRAQDGRTTFFGIDHAWLATAPTVLSTSLGWQGSNVAGAVPAIRTWAILGSASPLARLTFDASLHGAQGGRGNALFANLGASWQLAPEWTVAARYTEARGEDPQQVQVVSALTAATLTAASTATASRSLQLALRYEARAGTLPVPLGGTRASGAGALSGTVFFDADRNGRREAGENGAANVTVVLDGRFVARTDAAGRFEFPSVVAGPHVLQVQPDNVPLPWAPASQDPVRTEVLVRGRTVLDFPLQRER